MFNVRPTALITFTVGDHDISLSQEEAAQLVREIVDGLRPPAAATPAVGDPFILADYPDGPPLHVTGLTLPPGDLLVGYTSLFRREDNPGLWESDETRNGLMSSQDASHSWPFTRSTLARRLPHVTQLTVSEVVFGR